VRTCLVHRITDQGHSGHFFPRLFYDIRQRDVVQISGRCVVLVSGEQVGLRYVNVKKVLDLAIRSYGWIAENSSQGKFGSAGDGMDSAEPKQSQV
jgi:hypothetical protein